MLEPLALVEFAILGSLEARAEGEPVALGGPKQRALLAALLLDAGRVVSIDRLVEMLWSGDPPATAVASLQNFVAQLRKALGPGRDRDATAGLRHPARARAARRSARARASSTRRGRASRRGGRSCSKRRSASGAATRSRSSGTRRSRRRRSRASRSSGSTLLEEQAEARLAIGEHAALVSELEALVRAQPLRERLRAQLMLALYRSGRQADALEVYRRGARCSWRSSASSRARSSAASTPRSSATRRSPSAAARSPRSGTSRRSPRRSSRGRSRSSSAPAPSRSPPSSPAASGSSEVSPELARISQAVAVLNGAGQLYDTLHTLVESDGEPTPVHRFLAGLPALLRERQAPQPLLVTTGYELALERALEESDETYDTVCYLAAGSMRGSFCHIEPGGAATVIERPNAYTRELDLDARAVLLHLQGRVDRTSDRAWESFAVTEDDFINYGDVGRRLPVGLAARLRRTHLLLLGYTLSTWTLRVVLERLWGSEPLPYRSWSVNAGPQPLEREFWRRRDVEVVDMAPAAYVAELERALAEAAR